MSIIHSKFSNAPQGWGPRNVLCWSKRSDGGAVQAQHRARQGAHGASEESCWSSHTIQYVVFVINRAILKSVFTGLNRFHLRSLRYRFRSSCTLLCSPEMLGYRCHQVWTSLCQFTCLPVHKWTCHVIRTHGSDMPIALWSTTYLQMETWRKYYQEDF